MSSKVTGLVVEDESLLRLELAEELSAAGWSVHEAGTGEEALKLLARFQAMGRRFDFLITDIRLGGAVDGWEVAENFRKAWPDLPVIYVSANPIVERRKVQGSLFLSKPVDIAGLIVAGRALLAVQD
ncbi:MAG TPA: response regulator [Rhizomicrobium sp.]|nr:response regulator [Rhizomicrobium sp.]